MTRYSHIVVGLALLAAGCSSHGTVRGKVTHRGKPVVWGTVTLIASNDMSYSATIALDGTYAIPEVPDGPVKLCVTSPNPDRGRRFGLRGVGASDAAPPPSPDVAPPQGAWFPLPQKYADFEHSGLQATVHRGTTLDLNLD